jgi:ubiquinone/menaquinone biosynthesis C-methylase UbiE
VHLVDASPRLVDEARRRSASKPLASASVGDARRLPQGDTTADAVLVMGPLYHLTQAEDRGLALREGARVLRAGGVLVAAAISRYASALDGMARGLDRDPAFRAIRDDDLKDGQHRNRTDRVDYFTTAYFHRPEDLAREIEDAGFQAVACSASRDPDGSLRTWRLAGTMSALAGTT